MFTLVILSELHGGDIPSSNVMMCSMGGQWMSRVAFFGEAKQEVYSLPEVKLCSRSSPALSKAWNQFVESSPVDTVRHVLLRSIHPGH